MHLYIYGFARLLRSSTDPNPGLSRARIPRYTHLMTTDTIIEDPRWEAVDLAALAERAAEAALRHMGLDPDKWDICVMACDDTRIAALNADFRGKPQPTNVLSWPSQERAADQPGTHPCPPSNQDPELGDIAIAYDTCTREAADAQKPLADHTAHLIVHAVLHLLGYDHISDTDATLMEQTEVEILGKLGLDSPY